MQKPAGAHPKKPDAKTWDNDVRLYPQTRPRQPSFCTDSSSLMRTKRVPCSLPKAALGRYFPSSRPSRPSTWLSWRMPSSVHVLLPYTLPAFLSYPSSMLILSVHCSSFLSLLPLWSLKEAAHLYLDAGSSNTGLAQTALLHLSLALDGLHGPPLILWHLAL